MDAIVFADDLTGANEVAAAFSKCGFASRVRFSPGLLRARRGSVAPGRVLVVDTETRNLRGAAVARRLDEILPDAADLGPCAVYKKIDSTLRGPVSEELRLLMERTGKTRALVAPAFPAQGRTTQGGIQLVDGVPVCETAASRDPVHPVSCSHLPSLLARESGQQAELIGLEVVERGGEDLGRALNRAFARNGMVVADAATDGHLEALVEALVRLDPVPLAVGAAALAHPLAHRLAPAGSRDDAAPAIEHMADGTGVLVVSGSRHPATMRQVAQLRADTGIATFRLTPTESEGDAALSSQIATKIARQLAAAPTLLLAPEEEGDPPELMATRLGEVVAAACAQTSPAGLVMTGGETAYHALCAMGIGELDVIGEIRAGIPFSRLPGSGIPLVTKAGGFGQPDSLILALRFLQDMTTRQEYS